MSKDVDKTKTWDKQVRVLLCDESALLRVTMRKLLHTDPYIRVIDIARNGAEAIDKALRLKPDVILMGLHLPLLDGPNVLRDIVHLKIAPVIILSSPNSKDTSSAVEAIQNGAFDIIAKPEAAAYLDTYDKTIISKIKMAVSSNLYKKLELSPASKAKYRLRQQWGGVYTAPTHSESIVQSELKFPFHFPPFKAVVLGVSTGGPKSLFNVLPYLPSEFKAPVLVVQHMPPPFLTSFVQRMAKKCELPCMETEDNMKVKPGHIYIARGGCHSVFTVSSRGEVLIRHSSEPKHLFMPSVDIAMQSVCSLFGSFTIGVIMTGMGSDGAQGMVEITNAGGLTIAESEETAIVFGMPLEAIKRGGARRVLPHREIAAELIKAVSL